MTWAETLRTAWDAIRTRRMRSALTVLGILIGIAAVMLTVGLGQGAQQQVASQIGKLGSNLLIVSPGSSTSLTGIRGGRGSATTLTTADAAMLADPEVAPDIRAVAPTSSTSDLAQRERHQLDQQPSWAPPRTGCRCAPGPSHPAGCSPRPSSPACNPRWCSGPPPQTSCSASATPSGRA